MSDNPNFRDRRPIPPYGPTRSTMRGIELLGRITPAKVDSALLRAHRVAPGNEYKVVAALKFLGLIDAEGRPTERIRLLKARGPVFALGLQEMLRHAYGDIFARLNLKEANREQLYNYFVTEEGLGAEMAAKAARVFEALCRLAQIELSPQFDEKRPASSAKVTRGRPRVSSRKRLQRRGGMPTRSQGLGAAPAFPLVFALTPEVADMELDRLVELLRKMRLAIRRSSVEEG